MPTQRKVEMVEQLTEKMSRMQFAVVGDYRGLTVEEMYELRAKMREQGAEVIIAKNTLLRIAARNTGCESIEPLLKGPTAITFAYDDPAKVAKAVREYLKTSKKYSIRGGFFGTNLIEEKDLEQVSKMPSRETLYAQILGGVQSPISNLVGTVNAPLSDVVGILNSAISEVAYVLQARIDQMQASN